LTCNYSALSRALGGINYAGWFYGLDFNGGQKDIIEHH
jgi:hypothetical protein